ncbi:MAG TPA: hypothetical protein VMU75_10650 [Acidimicrobiales bacterium]|nr:hypothetical protein [Acidimicrobiales bacterium]
METELVGAAAGGRTSGADASVLDLFGPSTDSSGRDFLVLESCHSTWLFDTKDKRFCRVLKGPRMESSVATEWRSYDRLVLHPDSDAFVVFLDASGTRLLRSWRHTARCDQCGGDATAEMSLEDLRRVARA